MHGSPYWLRVTGVVNVTLRSRLDDAKPGSAARIVIILAFELLLLPAPAVSFALTVSGAAAAYTTFAAKNANMRIILSSLGPELSV